MNDLLPANTELWRHVEAVLAKVAGQYGYVEIRTPLLEKTALFQQSIGGQTDIVEKEMFTFTDAGDESLTLRPEATASTVRAALQHGLLHNQRHRLWYMGPMFRRERPQQGRFRQFHQFGLEAFGWAGPDIDVEMILAGERIWQALRIDGLTLRLNSLGSGATRAKYREVLRDFLLGHRAALDPDSRRRLDRNPLRILDSKHEAAREIVRAAPRIQDFHSAAEAEVFARLRAALDQCAVSYVVDPALVRGLDYYTSTVFEWTSDRLGAQSAVGGGGRYDSLVENRGGRAVPGVGFALGLERLVELIPSGDRMRRRRPAAVYVIDVSAGETEGVKLAEALRGAGSAVILHCGGGKLKARLRRADQSGAALALLIGDREQDAGVVQVKHLRDNTPDHDVPRAETAAYCGQFTDS